MGLIIGLGRDRGSSGGGGGGGGELLEKDVNFYDYEGTLLYAYSAGEFSGLSALPPNPSHPGLTAQGWNWDIADAKTYVANYGGLDIGQSYITDDGKTRVKVRIDSVKTTLTITVYWNQSTGDGVSVNFGDGSDSVTTSGTGDKNASHTYAAPGIYTITFDVVSGTMKIGNYYGIFSNNAALRACVEEIYVGSSVTEFQIQASSYYTNLKYFTIPFGLTGVPSFNGFVSLRNIVFPKGSCGSLSGTAFQGNTCIEHILLPASARFSNVGVYTFRDQLLLKRFYLPEGNLYAPVFYGSFPALERLVLPNSITNYTQTISGLTTIKEVILPSNITSIPNSGLTHLVSIESITIPASVTSIGTYFLQECHSIREIHLLPTTPPTLGANLLYNVYAAVKIYVPSGSLSAYQSASNWSSFANYMQEE